MYTVFSERRIGHIVVAVLLTASFLFYFQVSAAITSYWLHECAAGKSAKVATYFEVGSNIF